MAIATYKDLCIDAVDPARLGRFWAEVLGLVLEELDDGDARLVGPTPRHTVWVNKVPEPLTVKQRLHLDVRAESADAVERLGATVVDRDTFPWVVMKDPEGGELCVFPARAGTAAGLMELVLDTPADHRAIAQWWGEVLGVEAREETGHGFSYLEAIPGAPFESFCFVPVPEPKTVKNRIHLDLVTGAVENLERAGATVLRSQDDEIGWTIMADPAGNEFCAFLRA